ncbi:MAG: hypothetical protein LAO20_14435 [Acidobacteriia bacterium]|nr:hypothetical protein [Terriglobia bacterium]
MARHLTFPHHRSGWAYALDALKPLLKPDGVILDPFIEATFCWDLQENEQSGKLPYRSDWIAFIHNPPGIPTWHEFESAPQSIFNLPAWRQSLPYCRGIYVFSETMCSWLRERTDVPVAAAVHPTEPPERFFRMEDFLANPVRRIVQIGSWLRRLHSISLLKVTTLRKTLLAPRPMPDPHLESLLRREAENEPAARKADWSSVEFLAYQAPGDYDRLLAQNVVFLDLYDTVVNNTLIECVVRRTPVICNRLPSLVELLGPDYPLFFSDLDEAAAKADDLALIEKAHQYLSRIPDDAFSQRAFRDSIARADFYRSI